MKILTKLKNIALGGTLLLSAGTTASCAEISPGPTAQMTFVVKDDFGKPVEGAEVVMRVYSHSMGMGKLIYDNYKAKTNKDGRVVISGTGRHRDFQYFILGNKNYHHYGCVGNGYIFSEHSSGRWEPWNPTVEITYKPILNPVAHIGVLDRNRKVIPEREIAFGFDLFKNDWVVPHGKGERTDIVFTLEEKIPYKIKAKTYDYHLKVTFPNNGDGIQSCFAPVDRVPMRMPRYAPTDGYTKSLDLRFGFAKTGYYQKKVRDDQNYFFRIRTELDKKGEVKSAIYGKIHGQIDCDVINSDTGILFFRYELNPVPLDVNMEFDPQKNLLPKNNP
jgi:hypothetical protein